MKPSIPKGTRDFSPAEMARRNYIFDTIRDVFRLFGYNPIETPAMENLSTLMGKYGEEGDKLLFKILNSGDFLRGVDPKLIEEGNTTRLATQLCEKGLRYDLTVPFARYVVQHRAELAAPIQALSDTARVARRPSAERPLPRVLPVRRRCGGLRLAAQRGGAAAAHRRGISPSGHTHHPQAQQPQGARRHRRAHRCSRPPRRHHRGY